MPADDYWRMMTEQLQFSILSAPLACIDRRVLSQAWYSALRCARDERPGIQPFRCVRVASPVERSPSRVPQQTRSCDPDVRATPLHKPVRARRILDCAQDRRAARRKLARDIERVFCHSRRITKRATFTLGCGRERVFVLLQSGTSGVRLVAVCAPAARALVATALAQARYALARRGVVLAAERRTVCS